MNEQQMKKVQSMFYRLILTVLSIVSTYILYCSFCQINKDGMQGTVLKPCILILGTIVYVMCVKQLYCLFSNTYFNDKRTFVFAAVIIVLYFVGLCLFAHHVTINPIYDLSHIKRSVYASIEQNPGLNEVHYYQRYPNNIALLVIIKLIMEGAHSLGIENLSKVGNVLGALTFTLTAFLCFLTARKLRGNNMALLVLVIFVTNPLFYLYSSYYYTDVLSMPFSVFIVYMFVCFWKSEQNSKDYWKLVAAGLAIGMGYKIRATVIILFLAIIVWVFSCSKMRTAMKVLIVLCVGMAPVFLSFKGLYVMNLLEEDKSIQFPVTHWIMMGLNEKSLGQFNSDDFNATANCKTYEEKVAFNKAEIIARIKDEGVFGLYEHSKEKLKIVWSDGYGIPDMFVNVESYNKVYDYSIGTKNIFMRYYAQINRCALFFLMLVYFLNLVRKKQPEVSMLDIALLGAIVFYLLWETSPRYSVSFLPWMLLIMIEGVRVIELVSKKETIQCIGRVWKLNWRIVERVLAAVVLMSSVLFMITNQKIYVKEVKQYTDYAFVLPKVNIQPQMVSVGQKQIMQSFSTNRVFNQLSLQVDAKESKTVTNYVASLYEGENLIRSVKFTSNQAKKGQFLVLDVEEVRPKETSTYTVCIDSVDAKDDDSIRLVADYRFDSMANRELKVDGKKQERSLTFCVSNQSERAYGSMVMYWGVCIIIFIIELLGFGTLLLNRRS